MSCCFLWHVPIGEILLLINDWKELLEKSNYVRCLSKWDRQNPIVFHKWIFSLSRLKRNSSFDRSHPMNALSLETCINCLAEKKILFNHLFAINIHVDVFQFSLPLRNESIDSSLFLFALLIICLQWDYRIDYVLVMTIT